jgi:hypothetical protein
MSKFVSDLKGGCPRRDAYSLHERCDVLCPDLPKVMARKIIAAVVRRAGSSKSE